MDASLYVNAFLLNQRNAVIMCVGKQEKENVKRRERNR